MPHYLQSVSCSVNYQWTGVNSDFLSMILCCRLRRAAGFLPQFSYFWCPHPIFKSWNRQCRKARKYLYIERLKITIHIGPYSIWTIGQKPASDVNIFYLCTLVPIYLCIILINYNYCNTMVEILHGLEHSVIIAWASAHKPSRNFRPYRPNLIVN